MNITELRTLFKEELTERREEGCDVSPFAALPVEALEEETLLALYGELGRLSPDPQFPYAEPSDLEAIQALRPEGPRRLPLTLAPEALQDKILGAWLGRAAGCLLGKAVEGWPRHHIEKLLAKAGRERLDDYFPEIEYTDGPFAYLPLVRPWLAGNIERMPCDDDMNYTILGLLVLEKHGRAFSTQDVASHWLNLIPYSRVYTAEYIAYRNAACGLEPPRTATTMNPYREWIGAQIRADIWGYVNPGQPEAAAAMAWRDARLSHVKNGIYGPMFVAATLAAAVVAPDVETSLEIGLSEIPAQCRLGKAMRQVMDWCRKEQDWRKVWELIETHYGAYNRVHTINNAAYVVTALMLAEDDYERAITTCIQCGLDTDSTGATTGSIMGARLGAAKLPAKWVGPLHDEIETDLAGLSRLKLSELARRTFQLIQD